MKEDRVSQKHKKSSKGEQLDSSTLSHLSTAQKNKNLPSRASLVGTRVLLDHSLRPFLKLPLLELVYNKFAKIAASALRNYFAENVNVEVEDVTSLKFGDCLNELSSHSMIGIFRVVEWNNSALIMVENQLVYSFVEILLGGKKIYPSLKVEDRPFTAIETDIIREITELLLNNLSTAFESVCSVAFQLERIETSSRFAAVARNDDMAVLLALGVSIDAREGKVYLVLPYTTLEPVKKILSQAFIAEKNIKDPVWFKHFEKSIYNINVIVQAELKGSVTLIHDLLDLKVGDTIMLNSGVDDDVNLTVMNVKIGTGKLGKIENKVAIQLNEPINASKFKE